MEQIYKSLKETVLYVHIHRDEIEEIVTLLSQNDRSVVIATDSHKMASLDELFALNQDTVPVLKISAKNANYDSVYIDADKNGALVWCSTDHPDFSGIFYKLLNIVKLREEKVLRNFTSQTAWFLVSVVGSVVAFLVSFRRPLIWTLIAYGIYFTLFVIYAMFTFRFRTWCVISLKYRKETTNWWKDNRDKIILLVIGGVLGGILTALITFAARKLLPP